MRNILRWLKSWKIFIQIVRDSDINSISRKHLVKTGITRVDQTLFSFMIEKKNYMILVNALILILILISCQFVKNQVQSLELIAVDLKE